MFFRKKAPPAPLSDLCAKCSKGFIARFVQNGDPENEYKRAQLLCYLTMYGADHFINRDLNPKYSDIWSGNNSFVTGQNRDVLTAETIVWLAFLLGRLWLHDKEKDSEMRERIGYGTFTQANRLLVSTISDAVNFDFNIRAMQARTMYLSSDKERGDLHEVFARRLISSFANKSLSDSAEEINPHTALLIPLGLTVRLHSSVSIFFGTMPLAIYKTFKNALQEFPDNFPWG